MILNIQLTKSEALEILKKAVGRKYAEMLPDATITVEICPDPEEDIEQQQQQQIKLQQAKCVEVPESAEEVKEAPFEVPEPKEETKEEEELKEEPAKKSLFGHLTR